MAPKPRLFALAILAAVAGALGTGCYVEAGPPVYAYGYEPAFYGGYVVYYDDVGRPYYYSGGHVVWISPTVPEYPGYVRHWHAYGPAYHTWYVNHGYRYRSYHDPYRHR